MRVEHENQFVNDKCRQAVSRGQNIYLRDREREQGRVGHLVGRGSLLLPHTGSRDTLI